MKSNIRYSMVEKIMKKEDNCNDNLLPNEVQIEE